MLRATFPAGTVSGAPKVRAMEIIDELEPTKRGPYAGVVGYVDFSGNLDTAIAIRTMVWRDGQATLQAGAGIVADSDPGRRGPGMPEQGAGVAHGSRGRAAAAAHPHAGIRGATMSDIRGFDLRPGVVAVHGPDASSFLQSLLSQDLDPIAVGDGAPALLLQPQGKLIATLYALASRRSRLVVHHRRGWRGARWPTGSTASASA